jgi:hypothetical protein
MANNQTEAREDPLTEKENFLIIQDWPKNIKGTQIREGNQIDLTL